MRLPLSLIATAILLIISMAAGSYVDLHNQEMHNRHLAISTGLEKIVRLNQELNAMLLVSVLERNTLRSSSYQTVYDKLELTVESVENLTKHLDLAEDISALRDERRALRRVELQAFEHMEADQWPQAQALLFGERYVLARKIYEINSETALEALNGELQAKAEDFEKVRMISLVVRIGALGLLLCAGVMFSSRLRRELAKQERLKEEIAEANILLEDKVHERTAELEEANQKLAELSVTDDLTGLANRRHFDEVLYAEWQRARRHGEPLAVAMIDVDHFKAYNDHYGHQAGDECLRRVAAVLRACVQRSSDLIARYGGEEFIVVFPGIDCEGAAQLAETIRHKVQAEGLEHKKNSQTGVITISIGVTACIPKAGEKADKLLREADSAMYEAKRRGRNTVITANTDPLTAR